MRIDKTSAKDGLRLLWKAVMMAVTIVIGGIAGLGWFGFTAWGAAYIVMYLGLAILFGVTIWVVILIWRFSWDD